MLNSSFVVSKRETSYDFKDVIIDDRQEQECVAQVPAADLMSAPLLVAT
jgi:hypothetical protein